MTPAVAIGASRACVHDSAVTYRAVMESTGPDVVTAIVNALERRGLITPILRERRTDRYAVLDLLDGTADIVSDRIIPDESAWLECVKILDLRAVAADCGLCAPNAYASTYGRCAR